jgi:glycosidase
MPGARRILIAIVAALLAVLAAAPASHGSTYSSTVPSSASGTISSPTDTGDSVRLWSRDATIYEVNVRQYTPEGTFQAFEQHLPRLKDLGVKILWFMPIYPISQKNRLGSLGSYYSVHDYQAVNPEFGDMADFQHVVRKAHSLGMKVILDFVPNHTGWDNPWLTEHPDWYLHDSEGNFVPPPGTNFSDVVQLDWTNQQMRAALIDAMNFWVGKADIDGFRMDYVAGIPDDFWPQVHNALPRQLFMLAENEDKTYLLDQDFNANYGWTMFGTMVQIANGTKHATDLRSYLEWVQATYPRHGYPMLFTSNHDENSWNGTTKELFGPAEKTMAVLTFVSPGIPLIYSGQEAGLDKRLLFFDKDEIPWTDLSMSAFYGSLTALKKQNEALWNGADGGGISFLPTSNDDTLAFVREKAGNRVVVIVNLSSTNVSTTIKVGDDAGAYHDYFAGSRYQLHHQQTIELDPWEYRVLIQ